MIREGLEPSTQWLKASGGLFSQVSTVISRPRNLLVFSSLWFRFPALAILTYLELSFEKVSERVNEKVPLTRFL